MTIACVAQTDYNPPLCLGNLGHHQLMLDPYIARYVDTFDIDMPAIGRIIAAGRQHFVCAYQSNRVIKVPQNSLYMNIYGPSDYHAIERELDILNTFFAEFMPQTHVLGSSRHKGYVIVQERLNDFEFITQTNFASIQEQFKRMVNINRHIVREHRASLDFFGNLGLQRTLRASLRRKPDGALMNNLVVVRQTGQPSIKIVDTNLSELALGKDITPFRWAVDSLVFQTTRFLLRDNFRIHL
jgi:hypothetical protein